MKKDLVRGRKYRITEISAADTNPSMRVGDIVECADKKPDCIAAEYTDDAWWFADYQGHGNGYGTLVTGVEPVEAK